MKNSEEFDDKIIKDFFAKDNIISMEANNIFDETLNQISNMEKPKNKSAKNIIQKWMSVAACFLILLISANTYARSNGYENIFFMIKNVFINGEVAGAENLLSDREITISYSNIEIAEGLKIQIQKIVLEEKAAKLYVYVQNPYIVEDGEIPKYEINKSEIPLRYKVYDENNKLIADYISKEKDQYEYNVFTDQINIGKKVSENAKLKIEILNNKQKILSIININLENKQIFSD